MWGKARTREQEGARQPCERQRHAPEARGSADTKRQRAEQGPAYQQDEKLTEVIGKDSLPSVREQAGWRGKQLNTRDRWR